MTQAGQPEPEPAAPQLASESEAQQEGTPDPRNAEAARHRHRAKAAEDGLAAARIVIDDYDRQVQALQRQVMDSHIAATFADPADFHRAVDLADCLDDETRAVDLAKVDAAAQQVLAQHPHYARGRGTPTAVSASVVTTNTPTTVTPGSDKPSWSDVLNEGKKLQ